MDQIKPAFSCILSIASWVAFLDLGKFSKTNITVELLQKFKRNLYPIDKYSTKLLQFGFIHGYANGQRRIQKLVKDLRWSILEKTFMAETI